VRIESPLDLANWANRTHQRPNREGLIAVTFVVDEQASLLASSPYVTGLRYLNLRCNALGDNGLRALAASTGFSRVRELDVRANRFGDRGVLALAASAGLPELAGLDLSYNEAVTDAGWLGLARSPQLGGLRWLYLGGNSISPMSREALLGRFGDRVEF
jgi:hypothetical protein